MSSFIGREGSGDSVAAHTDPAEEADLFLGPFEDESPAARIPPGVKGLNVVQEKGPVGGVPEPGGLPAAPSAASPSQRYRTIVADPPWCYRNKKALKSGAALQYPVMPVEDIAALDVVRHAFFDAHVWLWTTNLFMEHAHWVLRSWGFEPVTILTWCKKQPGVGNYLRNNTEHCILGSRGFPQVPEHKPISTWYVWPRGEHSQKPEAFYDIVEQVSPGPYLELFSRRARFGWDTWGDEALGGMELSA